MIFEASVLTVLGMAAWFWFESVRAREIGMSAVRAVCRREGVQLLDDTVVCRSIRPARDAYGRMSVRRIFDFEYSGSGFDRFRGTVIVLGREVEMLDVSAHQRDPMS